MCTPATLTPPRPALVPKAMWAVPITFSSSSTLPVSVAAGFVPMPSSASERPWSPPESSVSKSHRPTSVSASTARPALTVMRTGDGSSPYPPGTRVRRRGTVCRVASLESSAPPPAADAGIPGRLTLAPERLRCHRPCLLVHDLTLPLCGTRVRPWVSPWVRRAWEASRAYGRFLNGRGNR